MGSPFRFVKWIAALALIALIVSCASHDRPKTHSDLRSWMEEKEKVRVVTTTPIVQDLVKRVGKEYTNVISIINGDLDPHSYEIVKGDSEKIGFADVVFANGLMLEHSASMQYQLHHRAHVVFLGDEVLKRYPNEIIYVDGQLDPHIWMDVAMWSHCIDPVVEKLGEIDPLHKDEYVKNGEAVKEEFRLLDIEIKERLASIKPDRKYLVTSHDAFNYHVRRYFALPEEMENCAWQIRMKALQGLAPDEQISVLQIHDIVGHICSHNITVVFPETNLSKDSLEKVREACRKRGKEITLAKETLYGDTLGGKDYVEMLRYNLDVMCRYLQNADEAR